jgi:hypothetical protein
VIRVAQRTTDLSAYQKGEEAVLRWSYPSMTTSGEALPDLEAIEVWRAALPLSQEPPPAASAQDRRLQRQVLETQGELLVTLVPDQLSEATRGPDITFRDDLRRWQETLRGATEELVLWYGVRTICCRGRKSELSDVVRLEPQEPPPAPAGLQLKAQATGIDVLWRQEVGLLTLVERSPDGAVWTQIIGEPVGGWSFSDTTAAQGRSWSYRLRSVRNLPGGGRVVGHPSQPARVNHPDTYPPPAPLGIVCLPEGNTVRIRWQSAPEAVVYRVTRLGVDGASVVLSDEVETIELTDVEPPLGEITYEVVAVDASGNRSAPAECSVVMGAIP